MGTHISHPSDSPFSNPHHLLIGWYPYLPIHVSILYISECYTIYVYFICLLLQLMPMYMLQASTQQPFSKRIPEISLWHSAVYKKNMVPLFFQTVLFTVVFPWEFPRFSCASNPGVQLGDLRGARRGGRQTDQAHRFAQTTVRQVHGRLGLLGGSHPFGDVKLGWKPMTKSTQMEKFEKYIYIHTYRERERDVCFVHKENHLQVHHANQVARLSKVFKNLEQTSPIQSYINWSSIDHQ